jgi:hypothetical protein
VGAHSSTQLELLRKRDVEVLPRQSWHAAHLIECSAAVGGSVDEHHHNVEEALARFLSIPVPDKPAPGLTSTPAH